MGLKTLVKVGSITNLSDARYCAGMGVDFLGFRVIPGQAGAISATHYQEIRGWITGPQIVAEVYGLKDPEMLKQIMTDFQPDFLELSLEEWSLLGHVVTLPFILALKTGESLPKLSAAPSFLLVEARSGEIGKFESEYEILVPVSTREELAEITPMTGVSGICLTGGQEIRPGLKQYDDLADILESLEAE